MIVSYNYTYLTISYSICFNYACVIILLHALYCVLYLYCHILGLYFLYIYCTSYFSYTVLSYTLILYFSSTIFLYFSYTIILYFYISISYCIACHTCVLVSFLMHITVPIVCMSYSYTYMTFLFIYSIICLVLLSCIVIMYCVHVLFSCTVSCTVHVLFSYTVFLLYFSYYFLFHILYLFIYFSCTILCTFHILHYHINFSDHITFLYIFIYHIGSYNLMLQNLSSHSSTMLLRSYHIILRVIFKSFALCFMPA